MTPLFYLFIATALSELIPGPNFWKIVHYVVIKNKSYGFLFICGLSLGSIVHCALGYFGISQMIQNFEQSIFWLQIAGGLYIVYYGVSLYKSKESKEPSLTLNKTEIRKTILDGLLTNFSNPKTILFYASIFSVFLPTLENNVSPLLVPLTILISSFVTNLFVGYVFSIKKIRNLFLKFQSIFKKTAGGILICLGVKIMLQKSN
jgi:threonine/homoserine/homoserine lactone efflux protein